MASAILSLLVLLIHLHCTSAIPTRASDAELALVTPAPTLAIYGSRTRNRRGIISDITSDLESDIGGILSELGSDLPSYVASGILPAFQGYPTGSEVLSSAGVSSTDLAAVPTQVLNIPGYGNWTNNGWNLRFHGNVFKQPNISNETIDDLANVFLIGTSVQQLPPSQSAQAVNLTREIFVVQQSNETITMELQPAAANDQDAGGIPATGGTQIITLPYVTTVEGDFDSFVQLQGLGLADGNGTLPAQKLQVYVQGTDTGNATSYLVSENGLTIVSDIDDILRVTKIYEPAQGLLNTFALPFVPWMNMPDIYANWSASIPDMHFHYLTTTPEQITRNYMEFIYNTYPGGSFDTRPLNFSDVSATLSIRKYLLIKVFQTFPGRKFILIADTSNSDVMTDYPEMATLFPGQVQCIFLRNTTATDPGDRFPYDTSGFQGLNQSMYMFFVTPDDLMGLDVENGHCYNASVPQNLTFSYQGLPFGLSSGAGSVVLGAGGWRAVLARSFLVGLVAVALTVL